ncbi:hypothetical protein I4U23_019257 [Adineta vaga]|nr:hypothetical protein I4U23_019257 [Adineta vaga]
MRFLLIQFFLVIFYQTITVTSVYNTVCTTKCNFPGMLCISGRCKCDWKNHLFWTGGRCLPCPNTACIGYYGVVKTRVDAQATCESMQGSLISLRDISILPLFYRATNANSQRKRQASGLIDRTIGWTSGQAVQFTNLRLYTWEDRNIPSFDSNHSWWCKKNTPHLGYQHTYNEPTRKIVGSEREQCILYRRGRTANLALCLDDIICTQLHPFVCERSESTAVKFPVSTVINSITNSVIMNSKGNTSNSSINGVNINKDPITDTSNNLGMLTKPGTSKSNKNTKTIIIILALILLLIAAIIISIFYLKKHRQKFNKSSQIDRHNRVHRISSDVRPSVISEATVSSDVNEENEIGFQHSIIDLVEQKQQKNKPSGSSIQRFDEFE